MRRFTDPVLFAALLVLDVIAWAVVAATSSATTTDPSELAPMTVASVVVIAAPALAVVLLLSLARALVNSAPRSFYSWALLTSVVSALVSGGASALTSTQGIQVGLGWMTWFFSVESLAYVVALVLALTGAIPAPQAHVPEATPQAAPEESPAPTSEPPRTPTPRLPDTDAQAPAALPPSDVLPPSDALPPTGGAGTTPVADTPEGDVAE